MKLMDDEIRLNPLLKNSEILDRLSDQNSDPELFRIAIQLGPSNFGKRLTLVVSNCPAAFFSAPLWLPNADSFSAGNECREVDCLKIPKPS